MLGAYISPSTAEVKTVSVALPFHPLTVPDRLESNEEGTVGPSAKLPAAAYTLYSMTRPYKLPGAFFCYLSSRSFQAVQFLPTLPPTGQQFPLPSFSLLKSLPSFLLCICSKDSACLSLFYQWPLILHPLRYWSILIQILQISKSLPHADVLATVEGLILILFLVLFHFKYKIIIKILFWN